MQCYEGQLMRDYLFELLRELDPTAARDDLLLDDMLDRHRVGSMGELLELGGEKVIALVGDLTGQLPMAA